MSSLTATEVLGMMEAYAQVYAPQEEEEVDIDLLSQEIFEEVAVALISQGYTAVDVLEYFANVDDEVIIEDIVALSEGTLLIESVVSEEYIVEQLQQLDEALPLLGLAARAAAPLIRPVAGVVARQAPRLAQAATKLGQRAANVVWKGGSKATPMGRFPAGTATAPGTKLIGNKNILQKAVGKVKDVAQGALDKLPGGSGGKLASGLKTAGKWALGGLGLEAGMRAGRALLGGDKTPQAKTAPTADKQKFNASAALGGKTAFAAGGGAAAMKKDPALTAADVQKRGTAALRSSAGGDLKKGAQLFKAKQQIMAGKSTTTPSPKAAPAPAAPAASTKPASAPEVKATNTIASKPTQPEVKPTQPKPSIGKLGGTSFERRTPTSAEFKGAQEYRQQNPNSKPEDVLKAAQEAGKREKQKTEVEKLKGSPSPNLNLNHYEYDAFDLVLEYLLSEGHVDTVDEAFYVMMEMDSKCIQSICEAAADQSDKQVERGVKTTHKAGNVIDNQHQGRSRGLSRLPAGERAAKTKRMRERLNARRADLFGERRNREDAAREEMKKKYGL